jgi:MFS family permease
MEVAWFGLALAATSRFLSVYAIRLGATPVELGWITSLPFVVLLCSTALSTRWRSYFSDSIKALFLPSLGFRFVFLFAALTPLFPPHLQPAWLIISAALVALPQGISSTIFVSMLREAVPEERLTALISKRTIGMNITLGIAVLGFGFWLELAPFPMNYQVMFLAAFALALVSHLQLLRVRVKPAPITRQHLSTDAKPLKSPSFQKVLFIGVVIHIGFFAILPITPLHLVDSLGATESFMALFGLAEIGAAAGISLFTSRMVAKIGYHKMVGLSMIGTAAAALIMAMAQNLPITIIAAAFSGASWTAATIGLFGLFTESTREVPNAEMTRYATIYHQLLFVAAFIGPLIGSNLANAGFPLTMVMVLGFCLRLLAGSAVIYTDHFWSHIHIRPNLRWATRQR